jgi:hypothetical protein
VTRTVWQRAVCRALLLFSTLSFWQEKPPELLNNMFPRWSHDAHRIVFASDRDGDPEIYVMSADGNRRRNRQGTWQCTDPGLSDHFKSGQRLSLQNRPTGLAVWD